MFSYDTSRVRENLYYALRVNLRRIICARQNL